MSKRKIYADNAATTQMSQAAIDTMVRYLATDYGNASQPYSFSRSAKEALKKARTIIADCIGAKPEEIYFTSGGSESDNWAIFNAIEQKRNIVTTSIEHHAILNPCKYAESKGNIVNYLPVYDNGLICPSDIENALKPNSILSVMMANNEIGTIEPIRQYGLMANLKSAIYHTDAVQAMGHIQIDVKDLGVDMLSASGHKFNGPKGVGFLYVKEGVNLCPLIKGGAQEQGMRAGTENVPSIMAMAIALQENVEHLDQNTSHLHRLEEVFFDKLGKTSSLIKRNGINQLPGLLSLSIEGFEGEALLHRLDLMGISISTGSACDSKNTQISHVLKAVNIPYDQARSTIRISLGKYNTIEDATYIAECLTKIVNQ